jgi:hypothetical protein
VSGLWTATARFSPRPGRKRAATRNIGEITSALRQNVRMNAEIAPLEEAWLPELSQFLCDGFQIPANEHIFFSPETLRWKYFTHRHREPGARSFVARDGGRIVAHVGITTTDFYPAGREAGPVSAVHMVDWRSNLSGGMLGTLLMLKAFSRGEVQYSLGTTEAGRRVALSGGFKDLGPVLMFYKVFHPAKRAVWRFLHGRETSVRTATLLAVDLAQCLFRRGSGAAAAAVSLRRVERFGEEVTQLFARRDTAFNWTARSPELLNYFLAFPPGGMSGWLIEAGGKPVGFALLSVVDRAGIRRGHIMDCFVASEDPNLWHAALARLTAQLKSYNCDVARCLGTTSGIQQALGRNGFLRRGRGVLYLRDTGKRLRPDQPFFLTDLEADMAY